MKHIETRIWSTLVFLFILTACQLENKPESDYVPFNMEVSGDEITFQFDEPIQKLEVNQIPISFSPQLACQWVWMNDQILRCILDPYEFEYNDSYNNQANELAANTTYTVTTSDGFNTLDGVPLIPSVNTFVSSRPKVRFLNVLKWNSPVEPIFYVQFNSDISQKKLKANSFALIHDGINYKLDLLNFAEYSHLFEHYQKQQRNQIVVLKPARDLKFNTTYHLAIDDKIKPLTGDVFSEAELTPHTFKTFPKSNQITKKYCSPNLWRGIETSGPCYLDDYVIFSVEHSLDFSKNSYCNQLMNKDILSDPPYTGEYSFVFNDYFQNQEEFTQCFQAVSDIFGNINNLTEVLNFPNINGFRPKLNLRNNKRQYVSTDEVILLETETMNLTQFYVHIDQLNEDKVDLEFVQKVHNFKNNISAITQIELPTDGGIQTVSGNIRMNEDSDVSIPFNLTKSPFHISMKSNPRFVSLMLHDAKSMSPVVNTEVKVDTPKGSYQGTTDEVGFVQIEISPMDFDDDNPIDEIALHVNYQGKPYYFNEINHFSRTISGDDSSYNFYPLEEGELLVWGLTDKPLYRAGEKVKYKLYIREKKGDKFIIPENFSGIHSYLEAYNEDSGYEIYCSDYLDCHSFFQKEITELDQFGSVSGEFTIPLSASNAEFTFQFSHPIVDSEEDEYWSHHDEKFINSEIQFQVTDFQTSPYLLSIDSNKQFLSPDVPFNLIGHANYYSGGPVINQTGEITVEVISKSFTEDYPQFDGYNFSDCYDCYSNSEYIGPLDYNHKGVIESDFTIKKNEVVYGYAKINSGLITKNGSWTYSQNLNIPYHQYDYYVGLKSDQYLYRTGDEINLESILVKYTGEAQPNQNFTFSLGHQIDDETLVNYKKITCSGGQKCKTKLNQAGRYKLKAKTQMNGMTYEHAINIYVYEPRYTFENNKNKEPLILTNKEHYEIGDIANIEISLPYQFATTAVYLERNNIIQHWLRSTQDGNISIQVPITGHHVPGFSITTDLISIDGNNFDSDDLDYEDATKHIKVKHSDFSKAFALTTDKESYEPGSEIKLSLTSDFYTDAEFTVAIIDEAVVNLIDDSYYYDLEESGLRQATEVWKTMNRNTLKPSNLLMENNGEGIIDYGDEEVEEQGRITVTGSRISRKDLGSSPPSVKGGILDRINVDDYSGDLSGSVTIEGLNIPISQLRILFKESAYFESGWVIKPGKQQTKPIQIPDNMGAWRIVVVGADQLGEIEIQSLSIKANKELEMYDTLPEQLTVNDQFIGQISVVSKSEEVTSLHIAAKADGKNQESVSTKQSHQSIKKNQQYDMPIKVSVGDTDEIQVTAIAETDFAEDGLVKNIPVRRMSIAASHQIKGQFNKPSRQLEIDVSEVAGHSHGELNFQLSSSIANQLNPTYNYMKRYPYNCWEQQLAKATAAAIKINLGDHEVNDQAVVKDKKDIQSIIEQSIDFQASNGGMTFFGANKKNVSTFLTFHTYNMMNELKDMGYQIPMHVMSHIKSFAHDYIRDYQRFRQNKMYDYVSEQSQFTPELFFMAYRITGDTNHTKKTIKNLTSEIDKLSVSSLNQLVMNQHNSPELLKALNSKYYTNGVHISLIKESKSPWYLMNTDLKLQCETVLALMNAQQNSISKDAIYQHLLSILSKTKASGEFGSTLENSVCLLAFNKFIDRYETARPDFPYNVQINDQKEQATNQLQQAVNVNNPIKIAIYNPEKSQVYYSAELKYEQAADYDIPVGSGLEINKKYHVFYQGDWIEKDTGQFKTGDWIKTEISITNPIQRSYIAVSSPNPGAWVPVNPLLNTSTPAGLINKLDKNTDSTYFYERQLKPATSLFYADFLPAGLHKITYYSQVKVAGEFSVLPATVEAMYNSSIRAQTELKNVKVEAN